MCVEHLRAFLPLWPHEVEWNSHYSRNIALNRAVMYGIELLTHAGLQRACTYVLFVYSICNLPFSLKGTQGSNKGNAI